MLGTLLVLLAKVALVLFIWACLFGDHDKRK